jgi:hypothetical protein
LANSLHDRINTVQNPLIALITGQPARTLFAFHIRGPRPILYRLAQSKDMRRHLWAHASLRTQASHGHDGGKHTASRGTGVPGGIGEEGTVVAVQDNNGQIWV